MKALIRSIIIFASFVALLGIQSCSTKKAKISDDLKESFQNPPASSKPKTWFHAMSGNMSAEGLIKDLESIERVGIGGILLFNVSQGIPYGPVKYNSDEHHKLIAHAAKECERLGLSFGVHNCDGWSSSGGPWIAPEQSMKMVVSSEAQVQGKYVEVQLPQPTTREEFYKDIAVLAYPSLRSEIDDVENAPIITSSDKKFDIAIATDNRWDETTLIHKNGDLKPWIQFEYQSKKEIRSVFFLSNERHVVATLQTSDDGINFNTVKELNRVRTGKREWAINESFPAIKSRFFRLQLNMDIDIKEVMISSSSSIPNFIGRTSAARVDDTDLDAIGDPADEMVIDKTKIIDLSAHMDIDGKLKTTLPDDGTWTILRVGYTATGAYNHPASNDGRGLECDKFSREAFKIHYDAFVKKVINRSKTSAPNAMQYVEIDSYESGGQNWTENMDSIFEARYGYQLTHFLPLLTGKFVESNLASEAVLRDFRELTCDLMTENYFAYFAELCEQDGIKSYIEPYGFGPVNNLDVGAKADINMGEFWMGREMKMVQPAVHASHIYGKNVISSESFTSGQSINWKANPAMAKIWGDKAWALGINEFMFHRFTHQANTHVKPGMTMYRWGFHFDRTQTWWNNAGPDWFKYIARGSYLLRQGVPVSDLLVFIGDGSPNTIYTRDQFEPELPQGINFDCVNADVLVNRIQLDNKKLVLPEGTSYRMLMLRNSEQMKLSTLRRIAQFSKAGVTIVGDKPKHPIGYGTSKEDSVEFFNLVKEIYNLPNAYSEIDWSTILEKEEVAPDFKIANRKESPFMHRRLPDTDIYFFYNPDSVSQRFECNFRIQNKIPELWDAITGEVRKLGQFKTNDATTTAWINLEAEESIFVIFRESAQGIPSVSEPNELRKGEYFLSEENKLFMETDANQPVLEIKGSWDIEFLKEHDYAAKHVFNNLTDWIDHDNENINYYSGTAVYNKVFEWNHGIDSSRNRYILDLGNVKIVAEVKLNGENLGVHWMPPFKVDITDALKNGKNQLEVKITNQWTNKLIGDERFPASYDYEIEYLPKSDMMDWYVNNEPMPDGQRTTFCTGVFYSKDDPLMPSGLLGPVQINLKTRKVLLH
ncbi:MAG: glycoside hydrolase [Flavobacteriales bacterium]|nr:glycoside hydrolase [Flavobacteriales bacterium]